MNNLMQWEKVILETVQLGGSLVFLQDLAPADVSCWVCAVFQESEGVIPVALRRKSDFLTGRVKSNPADLVFFFATQVKFLKELQPSLQGQRLVLGSPVSLGTTKHLVDGHWEDCDLSKWTRSMQDVARSLEVAPALPAPDASHEAPCLFLDRDDVIVKNVPYNKDANFVELRPGIEELIQRAHAKGYWVAVVTNQSGLGRGWVSWEQYRQVHQKMLQLLAQQGCWIDESVWAGFYEKEPVPWGRLYAGLRKPRSGMFQLVDEKLKVNKAKSVMVGDSATDLVAAFGVGIHSLYLVSSEKSDDERVALLEFQKDEPNFKFQEVTSFSDVGLG